MKFEELLCSYVFNDGETLHAKIDIFDRSCSVVLRVRKHIERQRFQQCEVELLFKGVFEVDISEDFRTSGSYSDITFTKTEDGNFYISIDPYSNTGNPNENDNFVIVSSELVILTEDGNKFQIT
jgi:hypothetical protein